MKMSFLVLVLVLFAALPARAQEATQWEVFGGATWSRLAIAPDLAPLGLAHINEIGWIAEGTENINNWFGATVDFSGTYGRPTVTVAANAFGSGLPPQQIVSTNGFKVSNYTGLFGPTFAYRKGGRFVPFARIMLGADNGRTSTTSKGAAEIGAREHFHTTSFAVAAGGGVDIRISSSLAIRGTADWIHTQFPDLNTDRQNNVRVAGGLVYRFGGER